MPRKEELPVLITAFSGLPGAAALPSTTDYFCAQEARRHFISAMLAGPRRVGGVRRRLGAAMRAIAGAPAACRADRCADDRRLSRHGRLFTSADDEDGFS